MPRPVARTDAQETRRRLLEAAGAIFADAGFEAATVTEITRRAGANVASVNYHFGDKLGLYVAAVRHALAQERFAETVRAGADQPADQRLRLFVRAFLERLFGEGRPSWGHRMMTRELSQATDALPEVVRTVLRPTHDCLHEIVAALLDRPPDDQLTRFAAHSVLAQCVHYFHSRHILEHVWPEMTLNPAQVHALADHIADFSLYGLHGLRAKPPTARPDKRRPAKVAPDPGDRGSKRTPRVRPGGVAGGARQPSGKSRT